MAGSSGYKDEDDGPGAITDINITPFVDILLVLLVVFMVTAKIIVSRGVEIDKPKAATGGEVQSTLRVSIQRVENAPPKLYVNGELVTSDADAIAKIKGIAAQSTKPKAIIAGDTNVAYGGVMHAIDLVQQAGVTAIALENQRP
jgi:biopolymer transport protein ExbD